MRQLYKDQKLEIIVEEVKEDSPESKPKMRNSIEIDDDDDANSPVMVKKNKITFDDTVKEEDKVNNKDSGVESGATTTSRGSLVLRQESAEKTRPQIEPDPLVHRPQAASAKSVGSVKSKSPDKDTEEKREDSPGSRMYGTPNNEPTDDQAPVLPKEEEPKPRTSAEDVKTLLALVKPKEDKKPQKKIKNMRMQPLTTSPMESLPGSKVPSTTSTDEDVKVLLSMTSSEATDQESISRPSVPTRTDAVSPVPSVTSSDIAGPKEPAPPKRKPVKEKHLSPLKGHKPLTEREKAKKEKLTTGEPSDQSLSPSKKVISMAGSRVTLSEISGATASDNPVIQDVFQAEKPKEETQKLTA